MTAVVSCTCHRREAATDQDSREAADDRRKQMPDEFVMVPVPASRVQEVYGLLAQPAGTAPTHADVPKDESGWNADLVRRMFKESGDPMQQMLRLLAETDGEE